MNWDGVQRKIKAAFPIGKPSKSDIIGEPVRYSEQQELLSVFLNKDWTMVDYGDIDRIYDALEFIAPSAVPATLPGFLKDPSDEEYQPEWIQHLLSYLASPDSKYLSFLAPEQVDAISSWLRLVVSTNRIDVDVERASQIAVRWKQL